VFFVDIIVEFDAMQMPRMIKFLFSLERDALHHSKKAGSPPTQD
jgi:hypothetical protein